MVVAPSTRFEIRAKIGGHVSHFYGTQVTADQYAARNFATATYAPTVENAGKRP